MDAAPVEKISCDDARLAIGEAREDIKLTFTEFQKSVSDKLEILIRETDDVLDLDKPDSKDEKLKEIKDKVEKIKEGVKSNLKPLTSLETSSGSLEIKGNITVEHSCQDAETQKKWQEMDIKLEDILEHAAMRHKHSEYKRLDASLQNCLKCLCIFPQDANIKKRTLIYWWIGEGIAHATADHTAEDIGEDYFQKLLKSSWIDPVNDKNSNIVRECTMDPWVRWLVIYIAREEYFFDLDDTGMPSSSPLKSRRACLLKKDPLPHLEQKRSFSKEPKHSNKDGSSRGNTKVSLLSVFNVNAEHLRAQHLGLRLKEMQSLVVLQLGRWQSLAQTLEQNLLVHHIEFVDENSEFFQKLTLPKGLRYLSLSGISRITALPISVKHLTSLKVLDLRSCQNLENLGNEIIFLRSLTHLDVSECYMLDQMPKGLGSLSHLEVLKGFMFGSLRSKDPCPLSELTKLKKLKKLSISIGSEAQMSPKEMKSLEEITGLRSLAITWGKLSLTLSEDDRKILEENWTDLRYPSELEKLDFRCFPNAEVHLDPENLKKLKKLYIRGGQVVRLNIHSEEKVKMNIEMVRLKFLHKLEEWPNMEEYFPSLNYMEIHHCPKLQHCPPLDNDGVWIKEPITDDESMRNSAPASESVSGTTVIPESAATTTDDSCHPPAISSSLPLSEVPTVPAPTSVSFPPSTSEPATTTNVPSHPPAVSGSLPLSEVSNIQPPTSIASPTPTAEPADTTGVPSHPARSSSTSPLSEVATTTPVASTPPETSSGVPSQPPTNLTSLPLSGITTIHTSSSIPYPTIHTSVATTADAPSQPPRIISSLPLYDVPTVPPTTTMASPTFTPDHAATTISSSAVDSPTLLASISTTDMAPTTAPSLLSTMNTATTSLPSDLPKTSVYHPLSAVQTIPAIASLPTSAPPTTPPLIPPNTLAFSVCGPPALPTIPPNVSLPPVPPTISKKDSSSSVSSFTENHDNIPDTPTDSIASPPPPTNTLTTPSVTPEIVSAHRATSLATSSAHVHVPAPNDTNDAQSSAQSISNTLANTPAAPVLSYTPTDSTVVASSAIQDKLHPGPIKTVTTSNSDVSETSATNNSSQDSSPANLSSPISAAT